MPSPFPGMDPYLEEPSIWPGFHHSLAEELKGQLNAQLGTRYFADVDLRTVSETVSVGVPHVTYPDVGAYELRPPPETAAGPIALASAVSVAPVQRAVLVSLTRLRAVRIYVTGTNQLVTTVEILSPYNKRAGEGLSEYRQKREQLLSASVHLMELDLLRGGERPGPEVADPPLDADYVLLVNRDRPGDIRISEIWPMTLNQPLPTLPVPLLPPDRDVALDLNAAVHAAFTRGAYEKRINYHNPAPPSELRPEIATWLKESLKLSR